MTILGVKVDRLNMAEAVAKLGDFLSAGNGHFVTTPNPEIILHAYRHPAYRDALNKADLAVPDGIGLLLASRLAGEPLKERVSGTDLVPEICRLARERGLTIALLGGLNQAVIARAAEVMRGWGNWVVYASHGPAKGQWDDQAIHDKMIDELRATAPDVLFAGFGHPKQEQWIGENRSALPSVRLFLGCGGALDFVAGAAKRAPAWMRRAGLEWLWRLIHEPKRIKRIWNAVIVFPFTVAYDHFRKR